MKLVRYLTCLLASFLIVNSSFGLDRIARLGIGYSNQLKSDIPSLSFRLQKNRSMGFGGMLGFSSSDTSGGMGAAAKIYRYIFDEPNLSFYSAFTGGLIKKKTSEGSQSGFEFDCTLGSEFILPGVQSLGFSLEFGVSANKLKDFTFETVGNNFLVAGVHFYL